MKLIHKIFCFFIFFALFFTNIVHSEGENTNKNKEFDYYTLALSWSPSYCIEERFPSEQCTVKRPYYFVVHGLWPQFKKKYPQYCSRDKKTTFVTKENIERMLEIMPSKKLIIHQWKKHGTCTHLSQDKYFNITQKLYDQLTIPKKYEDIKNYISITSDIVKTDFIKENKDLKANNIAISCKNTRLKEVRICYDKEFNFTECGINEANQCKGKIMIPPAR
jgi:ribonuclease T2